jgi:integrase
MPSVWVRRRQTAKGKRRFIVEYRIGGRGRPILYGGSFRTAADAAIRKAWISGELAARRLPDLSPLQADPASTPTLGEAAEVWRTSRVDVTEATGRMHRSDLARIFKVAPALRAKRLDQLRVDDVTGLIAAFTAKGYKRSTISKSHAALAMTLDHHGVDPNVARDRRVKLPRERRPHIDPPLAEHVEAVTRAMPPKHVLPLLILDVSGARVRELETATVGDLDEQRRSIRVRPTFEKNERYRYLDLPDDLFAALTATLPPREDRNLDAPLFPDLTDARLRVAITRACKATGTPHFSPHGLRRRRGSLHYKRTGSLADVAELLGDSKRVAADHYMYALTDYREVDRAAALTHASA